MTVNYRKKSLQAIAVIELDTKLRVKIWNASSSDACLDCLRSHRDFCSLHYTRDTVICCRRGLRIRGWIYAMYGGWLNMAANTCTYHHLRSYNICLRT